MFSNSSDLGKRVKKALDTPPSEASKAKTRTARRAQRRLTGVQLEDLLDGYEQGQPIDELATRVHGHEKVPGYGQLMSPLVATKVPASGH